MINKYKVKVEIVVNASDPVEALLEAGYQTYLKTYEEDTTKINIELLEEGEG
jgi:hypothetical protein